MTTTTMTTKGQIVIPSHIRRKMNMRKGTKLYIEERGEEIVIKAITPEYFEKIAGVLATKGKLSLAILQGRIKDKENSK